MAKSHAMARCEGYIASVRKGKKKKSCYTGYYNIGTYCLYEYIMYLYVAFE